MGKIKIDRQKCKSCQLCIVSCPRGLIVPERSLNKQGVYPVCLKGAGDCTGCALCAQVCPECCIEVFK